MASGVQAFVLGRNPQLSRNNNSERSNNYSSLEDLKAEVPKLGFTSDGQRPPSRGLKRSRSPPQMRKYENLEVQRFPGETEDDVFTVTSLATQEQNQDALATRDAQDVAPTGDDGNGYASRFFNSDGHGYRHGGLQLGNSAELNARQLEAMHLMDQHRKQHQQRYADNSMLQQYQEGDSYPESTSDGASVEDAQWSGPAQWDAPSNHDTPVRRYDTRVPAPQSSDAINEPDIDEPQDHGGTGWDTRPEGTIAHNGVVAGFQFAPPPRGAQASGNASPRIEPRQRNGNGGPPKSAAINSRSEMRGVTDREVERPPSRRRDIGSNQGESGNSNQHEGSKEERNPTVKLIPWSLQQPSYSPQRHPPRGDNNSKDMRVNVKESRNTRAECVDHETVQAPVDTQAQAQLDIEPTRLFKMDYGKLKAQPFDYDAQTAPFSAKGIKASDSLDGKLQAAGSLTLAEQKRFLASLTLEEWQEAGDWFVERFSELIRQMKQVRQSRRQQAHVFEDEVEQRQEAVQRKRAQTDAVLDKMKATGSLVLQGTPRKGRLET